MKFYDADPSHKWLLSLFKGPSRPVKKELLPFQAENVATNQQSVPLPYVAGTRLMAIRWITPATDMVTQQATGSGKKG